jgi:hypothetical protein
MTRGQHSAADDIAGGASPSAELGAWGLVVGNMGRIKAVLVGCVVVCALTELATAGSAGAATLRWGPVTRVSSMELTGLACPGASLCAAVDSGGRIIVSTRPGGGAKQWRTIVIPAATHLPMTGISCPSVRLCVAIDSGGNVTTSSQPANPRSWSVARIDTAPSGYSGPLLTGISCPSTSLCVVGDGVGNAITSPRPAGGATAWTLHPIDSGMDYECLHYGETGPLCIPGIVAVSCASASRCVAIDWAGGVLASDAPVSPGSWGGGELPASDSYSTVSCPSRDLCLLGQLYLGQVFVWRNGVVRPSVTLSAGQAIVGIWCRSSRLCFAADTGAGPGRPIDVFQSTDPAVRKPGWRRVMTTRSAVVGISCPATTFCVAAEQDGHIRVGVPSGRRRR